MDRKDVTPVKNYVTWEYRGDKHLFRIFVTEKKPFRNEGTAFDLTQVDLAEPK